MSAQNRRIVLASRPQGEVSGANFRLESVPVAQAGPGEVLVRTRFLSLDPYMRMRMNDVKSYVPPQKLDEVMVGGTVGEVVASNNPRFAPGDVVAGAGGWQEFFLSDGSLLRKLDRSLPLEAHLGPAGGPGLTAWHGIYNIIEPKAGETVLVTAAAGAVGSVAGQLAKAGGARVVGVAGGPAKCRHVVEELGFDACVDYKATGFPAALGRAVPSGIDGIFENVGGAVLDATMPHLNVFARIALCGLVSGGYNATPMPIADATVLLTQRVLLKGFILSDHAEFFPRARADLAARVASGQIKWHRTVAKGIASAPAAFIGMLGGANLGKQLVDLG
jgi:NADPH-dependent curcumin reductase CurA